MIRLSGFGAESVLALCQKATAMKVAWQHSSFQAVPVVSSLKRSISMLRLGTFAAQPSEDGDVCAISGYAYLDRNAFLVSGTEEARSL